MAYIHTIKHNLVALLGSTYAVYHPREFKRGYLDFSCGPDNLVIGEGHGGHPGLVVHDFESLVKMYLLSVLNPNARNLTEQEQRLEAFLHLDYHQNADHYFEFRGWEVLDVVRLNEAFASMKLNLSLIGASQMPEDLHPPSKDFDTQAIPLEKFETWFGILMGGFCYHHAPYLLSDLFKQALRDELKKLDGTSVIPRGFLG